MPFNYMKLKGRIIEKYGSQQNFAKKYGISNNSLSQKLNNKMRFTSDDIINMSNILDISKEQIGAYFFTTKV